MKKNTIAIYPLDNKGYTRCYRISMQELAELVMCQVSTEAQLKDALYRQLGILTPVGTSVQWGAKGKLLILKTKDVSVLQMMDDVMKRSGVSWENEKKR